MDLWLLLVLMALAVYRLTRLVVDDTWPPVLWARDWLVGGWRELRPGETFHKGHADYQFFDDVPHRHVYRASWSPQWLADLLSCPFCASAWVAAVVTAAVWVWLGLAVGLVVLLWLACWALGGLLAAQDWA